ncbi:COX15/CtaA family protein [Nocardioides donggukensis]|uniref:COX15/CtaA family protein n=1 Tax=Nocardioides donggukensis TaxID=2774019 RepID=A0A927K5J1_9ACTN|nr:COX15/CtaA family protein [Nocardioides donggukensis]MBD8869393.1 COX15/CtaA family protein [Nocardioides donggukensis]
MGVTVLATYLRPLAIANLVANIGIVLTGAAVRLTASGLGCPTWPRCTDSSYVPHGELGLHGAIEFGNRLLTFVLVVIAIACWAAAVAHRRTEPVAGRLPLRLATAVALGIPAQAVLGGLTVLTDLNPWLVAFHLLLSMLLIALCTWLVWTLTPHPVVPAGETGAAAAARDRLGPTAWLVVGSGWLVLYLGTVVTGSGPHAGDEDSPRTGLDPQVFSHVHASAVYLFVALTVGLLVLAHRAGRPDLRRAVGVLLAIEIGQGAVGFVQYAQGLPVLLVAAHLLGAALTSAALAWVILTARAHDPAEAGTSTGRATRAGT